MTYNFQVLESRESKLNLIAFQLHPEMSLSESDEENVDEAEAEMTMGIFSPAMKAKKGLQLNFGNILNQSITEGLDITLNFPGSPMASPMNSPMASRLASPVHAKSEFKIHMNVNQKSSFRFAKTINEKTLPKWRESH